MSMVSPMYTPTRSPYLPKTKELLVDPNILTLATLAQPAAMALCTYKIFY